MENKIIYLLNDWLKYFDVNSLIFNGSTYLIHKIVGSVIHKMYESIFKLCLIHRLNETLLNNRPKHDKPCVYANLQINRFHDLESRVQGTPQGNCETS